MATIGFAVGFVVMMILDVALVERRNGSGKETP